MHNFSDTDVMRAAEWLVRSTQTIMIADSCHSFGGWLDLYSYEPIASCVDRLKMVITSMKPHLTDANSDWSYRLFCPDGYFQCYSDGRAIDEDGEPVDRDAWPLKVNVATIAQGKPLNWALAGSLEQQLQTLASCLHPDVCGVPANAHKVVRDAYEYMVKVRWWEAQRQMAGRFECE